MLNNSDRFIIAHQTAKLFRSRFNSYRDAFAFAFMEAYAMKPPRLSDDYVDRILMPPRLSDDYVDRILMPQLLGLTRWSTRAKSAGAGPIASGMICGNLSESARRSLGASALT